MTLRDEGDRVDTWNKLLEYLVRQLNNNIGKL